jgi:hypothetical protein
VTFIQTLLTPKFVLQVSDRRLSSAGCIFDDSYNKAVSWCGMATVCFTGGFAHVDYDLTEPVTHWIAGVLAAQDTIKNGMDALDDGMKQLVTKLSTWPRRFPDRRLTIAMAGIAPDYGKAFFRGLSNFENGYEIFPEPSGTEVYRWWVEVPLGGNRTHYLTAGAHLGRESERTAAADKLTRIAQMGGVNNAARYMVTLQRRVAKRERRNKTNTVGQDAMVVSIPANLNREQMILMSSTDNDTVHDEGQPNFSFVRAGSFSRDRFAPLLACDGYRPSYFRLG